MSFEDLRVTLLCPSCDSCDPHVASGDLCVTFGDPPVTLNDTFGDVHVTLNELWGSSWDHQVTFEDPCVTLNDI